MEGGGVSDVFCGCIPVGGGCHRKGPVTPGPPPGLPADLEEASITGPEGAGRDMWLEEVREVGGSRVVQCLVGGEEYFGIDPLCNREPVEVVEELG